MTYSNTDLMRFLDAQNKLYLTALSEIKNGKKETHWMWFIFPQLRGLGTSDNANYYGIEDVQEASGFLTHPILGKHLIEISGALLAAFKRNPEEAVMNDLDRKKLHSSMTLFSLIENTHPIFQEVLEVLFKGKLDPLTIAIITQTKEAGV
ncbi:MAG: DUF1810 domain-containing protein [Bacteroidota bacterium]